MTTNGAHPNTHTGSEPIVRRVVLDSGVEVDIAPLSPLATAKIRERAQKEYPFPDEENYRKPLENAAVEGDTYIDRNDPEYVRLTKEAQQGQAQYFAAAVRDICLSYPVGKEALIEQFKPRLEAMREYIELPADEWEATFWYGIVASPADNETIVAAALSVLPISMGEVIEGENGLRVFRYIVQGKRPAQLAAGFKTLARGLAQGSKDKS